MRRTLAVFITIFASVLVAVFIFSRETRRTLDSEIRHLRFEPMRPYRSGNGPGFIFKLTASGTQEPIVHEVNAYPNLKAKPMESLDLNVSKHRQVDAKFGGDYLDAVLKDAAKAKAMIDQNSISEVSVTEVEIYQADEVELSSSRLHPNAIEVLQKYKDENRLGELLVVKEALKVRSISMKFASNFGGELDFDSGDLDKAFGLDANVSATVSDSGEVVFSQETHPEGLFVGYRAAQIVDLVESSLHDGQFTVQVESLTLEELRARIEAISNE